MSDFNRREFIKKSAITSLGISLAMNVKASTSNSSDDPIFKISLAEWSLNKLLFKDKMDHLDFAPMARKNGIDGIEYVNQFFMDKATDKKYLQEMKTRAESEGVKSLLIMCDREGALGALDEKERMQTVENHKKWVDAAALLGCHSIRVNGFSTGSFGARPTNFYEAMKYVADGLHHLCVYADQANINVIIENHGGHSSYAPWLMDVMKLADHSRAGTLPDFGNFSIQRVEDSEEIISYDSYLGTKELMPLAKGVSVKPTVWDHKGNRSELDYMKMMRIVLDAGYRGYCGIEHGQEGRIWESIEEVKAKLGEVRETLTGEYTE